MYRTCVPALLQCNIEEAYERSREKTEQNPDTSGEIRKFIRLNTVHQFSSYFCFAPFFSFSNDLTVFYLFLLDFSLVMILMAIALCESDVTDVVYMNVTYVRTYGVRVLYIGFFRCLLFLTFFLCYFFLCGAAVCVCVYVTCLRTTLLQCIFSMWWSTDRLTNVALRLRFFEHLPKAIPPMMWWSLKLAPAARSPLCPLQHPPAGSLPSTQVAKLILAPVVCCCHSWCSGITNQPKWYSLDWPWPQIHLHCLNPR